MWNLVGGLWGVGVGTLLGCEESGPCGVCFLSLLCPWPGVRCGGWVGGVFGKWIVDASIWRLPACLARVDCCLVRWGGCVWWLSDLL